MTGVGFLCYEVGQGILTAYMSVVTQAAFFS